MVVVDPNANPMIIHTINEECSGVTAVIAASDAIKCETIAPATMGAKERTRRAPIVMMRAASSLWTTLRVRPAAIPINEKKMLAEPRRKANKTTRYRKDNGVNPSNVE
mmetsp:Transcript_19781/g.40734  ORF Transcript_19781/g.40734 Transcript_19781/m.40734 type:complete len:108 (+) Transcript_19781:871-1194(+)